MQHTWHQDEQEAVLKMNWNSDPKSTPIGFPCSEPCEKQFLLAQESNVLTSVSANIWLCLWEILKQNHQVYAPKAQYIDTHIRTLICCYKSLLIICSYTIVQIDSEDKVLLN